MNNDALHSFALPKDVIQNNVIGSSGEQKFDIRYEVSLTRDPSLVAQYKALQKKLRKVDERFVGFRIPSAALQDDYEDPNDQFLLLNDGINVQGGISMRVSTPKNPVILNLEQEIPLPDGKFFFSLRESLPEMELNRYAHAEFDDLVLHPSFRTKENLKMILQAGLEYCIDYRIRYMFSVADMVRARLYSHIYSSFNIEYKVLDAIDIPVCPEHESRKRYILYADTRNFHTVPSDPEASNLLNPIENYIFY